MHTCPQAEKQAEAKEHRARVVPLAGKSCRFIVVIVTFRFSIQKRGVFISRTIQFSPGPALIDYGGFSSDRKT
jgi:hypothetical protein